jgi:hypothetical protein
MSHDRHQVALAARLHLQDGKAVVLIVEGHALDGPDERISGRGRVVRGFQGGRPEMQGDTVATLARAHSMLSGHRNGHNLPRPNSRGPLLRRPCVFRRCATLSNLAICGPKQ